MAAVIDRVSADDLMSLTADQGIVPMQLGAILVLDTGVDADPQRVVDALRRRVSGLPRLRQRLDEVPFGQGRPVWVDDERFRLADHVRTLPAAGGGMRAALDAAGDALTARLPRSQPLWTATILPDIDPGRTALVLVVHHVLADGLAGMTLIAELTSPTPAADDPGFPRPRPAAAALRLDVVRGWVTSIVRVPVAARRLASALVLIRPGLARRLPRTSLNQRTGGRRRLVAVSCDLEPLHASARAGGVTIDDVLLAVVVASLDRLLRARGETPDDLTVSVPFSSRGTASSARGGNASGVVLLRLPGHGAVATRWAAISRATRDAKRHPRGATAALLGPAFRVLARLGLLRRFIDTQRSMHTIVSDVRGPEARLGLAGLPVVALVPLSAVAGNITVSFVAASYAGRFTITVVADPSTCLDLDRLAGLMEEELRGAISADVQVT